MNQPLFFVSDPKRTDEFRIETRILKRNKGLVAEKRAVSSAALPHLDGIIESYKLLSKLEGLRKKIHITPARKVGEAVEFDFIEGKSAERVIIDAILDDENQKALLGIDRLISIIDALPQKSINPIQNDEYSKIFGRSFNKKLPCVTVGLIDVNPDNMIVDGSGKWHLIDYEWLFNFPIPRIFIIQRSLLYFFIRHQEALSFHRPGIEQVVVSDTGIAIPKFIYQKYKEFFDDMQLTNKTEQSFQKYVEGDRYKPQNHIGFLKSSVKAGGGPVGIERFVLLEKEVEELRKQNRKLSDDYGKLIQEKQVILDSTSYRLGRKIIKIFKR